MAAVDFNRPVTLRVGAEPVRDSPHKSAVSIEQFLTKFYGEPAQAPHGNKFKPDTKAWQEYTLLVSSTDMKTKASIRAKGKGHTFKVNNKVEEPKSEPSKQTQPTPKAAPAPAPAPAPAAAPAAAAPAVAPAAAPAVKDTIPVGLLFPGQGSQYVKMLSSVKDIPAVKDMMSKANDILGFDVLKLCLEGPESKLEETQYCQPVMFIAGLAGLEKLREQREGALATRFQATAGLSLGEYTALCAAGVFSFEDGLKLVQLRGKAMQDAAAVGKQLMLSVAGVEKDKLSALCKEAAKEEGAKAICQIANELFPKGFACAGTEKAVLALKALAEKNGALQAKVLKTSGAFHTDLMGPAKQKLSAALDEMLPNMKPPQHTVYMNVTATAYSPGTDPKLIVDLLKRQLTSPVLWEPSMRAMIDAGITEFYEVGPQKQLKAMMKRINPKMHNSTTSLEI